MTLGTIPCPACGGDVEIAASIGEVVADSKGIRLTCLARPHVCEADDPMIACRGCSILTRQSECCMYAQPAGEVASSDTPRSPLCDCESSNDKHARTCRVWDWDGTRLDQSNRFLTAVDCITSAGIDHARSELAATILFSRDSGLTITEDQ